MEPQTLQWVLLVGFGLLFFLLAPFAKKPSVFFAAVSKKGKKPGTFLLTSSLVISWIFAKSITNAANLGLAFGIVGGVAYAVYYLSFLVAGIVIYQLRVRGGFASIHEFLATRYGQSAVMIFSLLIGFRLFNEVWSNTMVIGSYFGAIDSLDYYAAIIVFTLLTLAYTLKGGLRSSLLTDAIQMVFFGVLIFVVLGLILPAGEQSIGDYVQSGEWTLATGVNLLLVALLQIFSYPFHDSVLTDRGFISDPSTTLRSYVFAVPIGFVCIVLFSLVGVFAQFNGLEGQAAVEVSKLLGVGAMLVMNFIMVTSAASTLDSAFTSSAKLMVIDLRQKKEPTVWAGRIAMIIFAGAGTLPIFFTPEILAATTISGTMVLGLAPIFLWWQKGTIWSFHLAVGFGVLVGAILALGYWPPALIFFSGKYGDLLSVNLIGTIGCFLLFYLGNFIKNEQ